MTSSAGSRSTATALAVGMTILTCVVLAVGFAGRIDDPSGAAAFALGVVITSLVGATVASRRSDHPTGWLLLALPFVAALSGSATDYVQSSLSAAEPYPGTVVVGWASTWLGVPTVPLAALLLLTFPTGTLPSPRWRWAVAAIVAAAAVQAAAVALMPGGLPIAPSLPNPLGIEGAGALLEGLSNGTGLIAAVVLLFAVGRLLMRFRRATGLERDQLRTLAAALPITVAGMVAAMLADGAFNEASFYFAVLGLTAIPVAIGYAVLRHGLFDIELFVNRAVVYTSLTLTVGVLYLVTVNLLGRALRQPVQLGVSVVATAMVAVAFAPMRDRLQRLVDRLMYGERTDPYAALSGLGRRLRDAVTPEQALPATAETLGRSLKLDAVLIEVHVDGAAATAAAWGMPGRPDHALGLELVHGRELVGRLQVWPRPGETLAPRDRELLADLCGPIGVAVHAARVDRELQTSRQVLVTTREAERRRLRADLHDGLGPELAGVVLGLAAARNTIHRDPDGTADLLDQLRTQLREAVTQVRSLVEGMAPTVDQLGLVEAVREGARRLTVPSGIDLELDLAELHDLPPAVEVAAYRIVMEALTNAVRHGSPSRCSVALRLDGGLRVEIRDDGHGLPGTIVPGVGLSSMRQRAEELGGSCTIEPATGGGTRVLARLPL